MAEETWAELKIGKSGVSATLYTETEDGEVIVEDETWYTHDEIDELSAQTDGTTVTLKKE